MDGRADIPPRAPGRRRGGLWLLLAPLVLLAACTKRPVPPPDPATLPPPVPVPSAPAPVPEAPADPEPPPTDVVPPPPQAKPWPRDVEPPLADAERGPILFTHWRSGREREVEAFEGFLVHSRVAEVVPTYQLLRSASMWKECRADPFQVPPRRVWPQVRDVLVLLDELRERGILDDFEVVSAYRNPKLNRCAGGAPGSSHVLFAVDLAPLDEAAARRLCRFWRDHGKNWDMGVSRYPSGRVHIDRNGYRTWGASHGRGSSYCLR